MSHITRKAIDATEEIVDAIWRQIFRGSRRIATYRLQFHFEHLRFGSAAALVPYLHQLGFSHVYASPIFKTRANSPHGYDVVDHCQINPDLGGDAEFANYLDALHLYGLKQIVDVVPNHMSVGGDENQWWLDVLSHGPASRFSGYFDIDWKPVKRELEGRILLPILSDLYGRVLESGGIQLAYEEGAFWIRVDPIRLPIDPKTWVEILDFGLLVEPNPGEVLSTDLMELQSILTAIQYLPERDEVDSERVVERQRESKIIQARLRRLFDASSPMMRAMEQSLANFRGTPGQPKSFDRLDRLLDRQVYRLVHWKAGSDELNYRRFFDVTDLAALCMENVEVFLATHELLFQLYDKGQIDGLRIDHIDGLLNPEEYLWRLQWSIVQREGKSIWEKSFRSTGVSDWPGIEEALLGRVRKQIEDRAGGIPGRSDAVPVKTDEIAGTKRTKGLPVYVLAEKILGFEERLNPEWPVDGTTGYDFLNLVNGLFVDVDGLAQLTRHYHRFIDDGTSYTEIVYQSKRLILSTSMQSEVQLLAHRLDRISHRHRHCRDFTLQALRSAVREIIACFPVYRTYIRSDGVSHRDSQIIHNAVTSAMRRNPNTDRAVYHFIRDVLLLQAPAELDEEGLRERAVFVGRFQQVTSPVMAKGVEDTAFYRYLPLTSLDEVGGDPPHATRSVDDFHQSNMERERSWPGTMLCTTTHDTKRSEDVRARLHVLSETPGVWRTAVQRWSRMNRRFRREVEGQSSPSRNDEWLFYQTLVGVWPDAAPCREQLSQIRERLKSYMEKATHEAKLRTSWINPNPQYDDAVKDFIDKVLDPEHRTFMEEISKVTQSIAFAGYCNSLSQLLLKLTSPGIPDFYQGQETWDFSLVDPDNRRAVDFGFRADLLAGLVKSCSHPAGRRETARRIAGRLEAADAKLFVTWTVLRFRQDHPEFFEGTEYVPLSVHGKWSNHICAFARWREMGSEKEGIVVVVPRLWMRLWSAVDQADTNNRPSLLSSFWADTTIEWKEPESVSVQNVLTGRGHSMRGDSWKLSELFRDFPMSLLRVR